MGFPELLKIGSALKAGEGLGAALGSTAPGQRIGAISNFANNPSLESFANLAQTSPGMPDSQLTPISGGTPQLIPPKPIQSNSLSDALARINRFRR